MLCTGEICIEISCEEVNLSFKSPSQSKRSEEEQKESSNQNRITSEKHPKMPVIVYLSFSYIKA